MNKENRFKVGDYVITRNPYWKDGFIKNLYRGQICDIFESTPENGHGCDEVMIIMDDLKTYSDFFYVFEFDIEKYRENKLDNLLM